MLETENSKTMPMKNFGEQTKCIMRNVELVNQGTWKGFGPCGRRGEGNKRDLENCAYFWKISSYASGKRLLSHSTRLTA